MQPFLAFLSIFASLSFQIAFLTLLLKFPGLSMFLSFSFLSVLFPFLYPLQCEGQLLLLLLPLHALIACTHKP